MDGAVELLKELLTIRSVNGRDDEGAVAEYLCKYFEQSGISAHIQRIDATHANVLAELEPPEDRDLLYTTFYDVQMSGGRKRRVWGPVAFRTRPASRPAATTSGADGASWVRSIPFMRPKPRTSCTWGSRASRSRM